MHSLGPQVKLAAVAGYFVYSAHGISAKLTVTYIAAHNHHILLVLNYMIAFIVAQNNKKKPAEGCYVVTPPLRSKSFYELDGLTVTGACFKRTNFNH